MRSSSGCRSGCQWDQLPEWYGPKSTVHDWFHAWAAAGIFERIWAVLVAECDELGGVQWEWQPADAMLGKARFGEKDGKNPTDRGKGHQKSLVTDGDGGPLGVVIAGANGPGTEAPGSDDREYRGRAARTDKG